MGNFIEIAHLHRFYSVYLLRICKTPFWNNTSCNFYENVVKKKNLNKRPTALKIVNKISIQGMPI